jgi:hypothetical protein
VRRNKHASANKFRISLGRRAKGRACPRFVEKDEIAGGPLDTGGGERIAGFDRGKAAGGVGHETKHTARRCTSQPAGSSCPSILAGDQSSFRIVPMPRFFANSELLLFPNRSK